MKIIIWFWIQKWIKLDFNFDAQVIFYFVPQQDDLCGWYVVLVLIYFPIKISEKYRLAHQKSASDMHLSLVIWQNSPPPENILKWGGIFILCLESKSQFNKPPPIKFENIQ